jgi:5-methylcytosine-specific restriction endonuclease McrA
LHATLDIVHPSQRRLIVKRLETERSGPSADRSVVPLSSWLAMRATAVRWRKANKVYVNQPAWQDDHIIPVALGGDWFDLRNHQTLCCSCHHAKTKIDTRTIRERKADRPG